MKPKKKGKLYVKTCRADITKEMWIELQEMKVKTGKPKAVIIREALELFKAYNNL